MMDIRKVIDGLEYCGRVGYCNGCPYPTEWISENCPKCDINQDAAAAIRECVDEIEQLRDQVHNMTIYMEYVQKTVPTIVESMAAQFSGMPGYCAGLVEEEEDDVEDADRT